MKITIGLRNEIDFVDYFGTTHQVVEAIPVFNNKKIIQRWINNKSSRKYKDDFITVDNKFNHYSIVGVEEEFFKVFIKPGMAILSANMSNLAMMELWALTNNTPGVFYDLSFIRHNSESTLVVTDGKLYKAYYDYQNMPKINLFEFGKCYENKRGDRFIYLGTYKKQQIWISGYYSDKKISFEAVTKPYYSYYSNTPKRDQIYLEKIEFSENKTIYKETDSYLDVKDIQEFLSKIENLLASGSTYYKVTYQDILNKIKDLVNV